MTLVLLVALALQSNAVTLTGTVVDTASLPLAGATVEVDGHVVTVSNEHGRFEIRVPAAGARLRVSLDRFEPYESFVEPGMTRVEIVLGPASAFARRATADKKAGRDDAVRLKPDSTILIPRRDSKIESMSPLRRRGPVWNRRSNANRLTSIVLPARRPICSARCRRFPA